MNELNFSSFLHIIQKFAVSKKMTDLVRGFLSEPIKKADIRDERKKQYKLTPVICSALFKGNEDIYPNLRKGLNKYLNIYAEESPSLIVLLDRLINPTTKSFIFKDLLLFAEKSSNLNITEINQLKKFYREGNFKEFFKLIFKFSIMANNKTSISKKAKREINISDENLTTKNIIDILMSKPRPTLIVTPDEIDKSELKYVKELLSVYSEKKLVTFKTKTELEKYPSLLEDFEEQRRYYYSAESIRRGIRDTEIAGKNIFDEYKDEVFEGIKETSKRIYSNKEDKLNEVLDKVTLIPLNSFLANIPGWITCSERKGTCHMLVNDGKLKWSNKDVKE